MTEHTQTTLLSLPAEIRRGILRHALAPGMQLHLYIDDGRPCVSQCLGAKLGEEEYHERDLVHLGHAAEAPLVRLLPSVPGMTQEKRMEEWGRRLRSKWANHYMCKEHRDGKSFADHPEHPAWRPGDMLGLLACKQMWADGMEVIGELLQVTVTDLEAAQYLTSLGGHAQAPTPTDPSATQSSVPVDILRSARSVNLSLYRSIEFYHAISGLPVVAPGDVTPDEYDLGRMPGTILKWNRVLAALPQAEPWRHFCAGLATLPRLTHVTLWLDNDHKIWSGTDERALLSPLLDAAGSLSKVVIGIYLPEIRADKLRPKKHLLPGEELPLRVQRTDRRPVKVYVLEGVEETHTVDRFWLRMFGVATEKKVEET